MKKKYSVIEIGLNGIERLALRTLLKAQAIRLVREMQGRFPSNQYVIEVESKRYIVK